MHFIFWRVLWTFEPKSVCFFNIFSLHLIESCVIAGDRKWKDAGVRYSRHRAAPEERREAEEDAGEDETVFDFCST